LFRTLFKEVMPFQILFTVFFTLFMIDNLRANIPIMMSIATKQAMVMI
jgi:hypothetical protein